MRKQEIVVIGGNAAGPAAAAKAKRVNPDAEVKLFEAGPFISTGTCELPYLFSNVVDDYKKLIFFSPEKFYEEKNVTTLINHKVESINRREKKIIVKNQNDNSKIDLAYDKLVIATGSKPKIPSNGRNAKNLFTLKSVSDYLKIAEYLRLNKVKDIIILGSGYIGIEVAENLKKMNYNVLLVEKAAVPMPSSEREISSLIKDKLDQEKIESLFGFVDMKFNFRDERISSISFDGRIVDCCMVIAAVGVKPNSDLAVASGLNIGQLGGVSVDAKLKTTDPDIFACGDCIEIKNSVTNKYDYLPLATLAHTQGHIAGENAAGGNTFYDSVVKNVAVKIFDNVLVSVGISSEKAKQNSFSVDYVDAILPNLVKVMPDSSNTYGKIIFEKGSKRILGAEFFGKSEVIGYADLISALIAKKENIDFLSKINFNYTPPNSPFINILSLLGRKAADK